MIAGGGFAGLRLAVRLSLLRQIAQVVMIERGEEHQLVTRLHLGATAVLPAEQLSIPYRLPPKIVRLRAEIERIRPAQRLVETDRGAVAYEKLVIALGSRVDLPPIPGLESHAFRLRWKSDAERLRHQIESSFLKASREPGAVERRSWMRVIVAGGGYTGCQLAGELAHWLPNLATRFGLPLEDIDLVLAELEERLLPGAPAADGRRAAHVLQRKGVRLLLGTPLRSVSSDRVEIGDEGFRCRNLIWCGGIRGPEILEESGLPVEQDGRCPVDLFLKPEGFPSIHIAGDSARVGVGGSALPATAAQAIHHGDYLAGALRENLENRRVPGFEPEDTGLLISLGGTDAVGDLLGFPLDGAAAGLAKSGIEAFYSSTAQLSRPGL